MAACARPFGSCGFIGGLLYLKLFLPRPLLLPFLPLPFGGIGDWPVLEEPAALGS